MKVLLVLNRDPLMGRNVEQQMLVMCSQSQFRQLCNIYLYPPMAY